MRVLLYAKMLKETEVTSVFCDIFIIGSISTKAGEAGLPLAKPMLQVKSKSRLNAYSFFLVIFSDLAIES